jgi:hypothetical protein
LFQPSMLCHVLAWGCKTAMQFLHFKKILFLSFRLFFCFFLYLSLYLSFNVPFAFFFHSFFSSLKRPEKVCLRKGKILLRENGL